MNITPMRITNGVTVAGIIRSSGITVIAILYKKKTLLNASKLYAAGINLTYYGHYFDLLHLMNCQLEWNYLPELQMLH